MMQFIEQRMTNIHAEISHVVSERYRTPQFHGEDEHVTA
jgi:hypothetical protein